MQNIERLLIETNARITLDNKWLVCSDGEFIVYGHKAYSKHTTRLYEGQSLEDAITILRTADI